MKQYEKHRGDNGPHRHPFSLVPGSSKGENLCKKMNTFEFESPPTQIAKNTGCSRVGISVSDSPGSKCWHIRKINEVITPLSRTILKKGNHFKGSRLDRTLGLPVPNRALNPPVPNQNLLLRRHAQKLQLGSHLDRSLNLPDPSRALSHPAANQNLLLRRHAQKLQRKMVNLFAAVNKLRFTLRRPNAIDKRRLPKQRVKGQQENQKRLEKVKNAL
ncbi:hypothetical protein ANCDUO_05251 [Ancylostoma duodenale]|uniref:Uncharacterized protein n=1 Tax=Ancylostoma duodenale TaxID=51022 RepID=A0A0C2GT52_9BILA|nr:hypothetical protein ANCDUO_05251 [Ancylostoma duodenale]